MPFLDYSSYYRIVNLGELLVLRNRHGKYAVLKITKIISRDRTPAPRSLLEFSYYILPEGDDFSKVK